MAKKKKRSAGDKNPGGRPATGHDPIKSIRMNDELWEKAKAKAARQGKTLAQVLRDYLTGWVKRR